MEVETRRGRGRPRGRSTRGGRGNLLTTRNDDVVDKK